MKKKSVFYGIMMLCVAFFVTSCGPKIPESVLLGDGNLSAYAVLKDKAAETFRWGVRLAKSGTPKINCVFIAPPKELKDLKNYYVGETENEKIIFDNEGKILIQGTQCHVEKLVGGEEFIMSTAQDGQRVYIVANKKTVGPKEKLLISAKQIYYNQGKEVGVLSYDNKEILPPGQEELYAISVKNAEKSQTSHYLAKDAEGYKLYDLTGKLIKKIPAWQVKKYTKDARSYLGNVFFNTIPKI